MHPKFGHHYLRRAGLSSHAIPLKARPGPKAKPAAVTPKVARTGRTTRGK